MRQGARASGGARRVRRLALAALLTLLVCAIIVTYAGFSLTGHDPRLLLYLGQQVDAVHATREHLDHNGVMTPLDRTVTDARATQALYNAAFALPVFPSPMNCPLGPNVVYHLAFSRHGAPVLTDDLSLDGCVTLTIGGMSSRMVEPPYMALLAQALGMSVDAIESPLTYTPTTSSMQLTVERIGETFVTRVAPLTKTFTDTNTIQQLDIALDQDATYGGSQATPPASACPPNDGVLYRLSFSQGGAQFTVKDVEATGCQLIFSHDGFPPEHISNPDFWTLLAHALGVPLASLGVGPTPAYWDAVPTVPAR